MNEVMESDISDLEICRSSTWHSNSSLRIFKLLSSNFSTAWKRSVTSLRWISV